MKRLAIIIVAATLLCGCSGRYVYEGCVIDSYRVDNVDIVSRVGGKASIATIGFSTPNVPDAHLPLADADRIPHAPGDLYHGQVGDGYCE